MSRSSKRIAAKRSATTEERQAQYEHNAEVANESRFALTDTLRRCHYQQADGKWARNNTHCWHTKQTEGPLQQECCRCPAMRPHPGKSEPVTPRVVSRLTSGGKVVNRVEGKEPVHA